MTAPGRDWLYLRLLLRQMARDAQAVCDAIPLAGGPPGDGFAAALSDFGELVHQYCLFGEGATSEDRLADLLDGADD